MSVIERPSSVTMHYSNCQVRMGKKGSPWVAESAYTYSVVTDFAKFRGKSTS